MRKRVASAAAAAVMSVSCIAGQTGRAGTLISGGNIISSFAAVENSVKFITSAGYGEGMYATWSSVSGASDYSVYVDGTKIDSMLVRQYPGYLRADALGLKAGSHTMKVVPVISGKEDASKAAEVSVNSYANDRSGFGFVNGTSSGAYNEDGTLKSNATVIYITNANKDSVTVTLPDKKGAATEITGVQNIITDLKSNTSIGPVCIRFIGNITDPSVLTKGDLYVDTATCGLTIEGVGSDTTFNGFGLVLKNTSNCEIRNIGFMNCDSTEGDDCGLQQGNDHIWVHNCDFFYGDAGSDADQVKGDGALDTKKSTYVTHSYNHFWDNGKCNLQGMKEETTSNYITYHHNWYDHSDSRHPRIRTCTVHCYNNYFDGNAKYGVGVTLGSSCFVENNYFRNCSKPMLISMQGTDMANGKDGATFSSEDGGIIKSYGNYMTGQQAYVTYQQDAVEFDAYEASSRDEKLPASVTCKQGGTSYNNFDTDPSLMYSYTPDKAEDVPGIVTAKAGRVDGGDLQWQFNNSVDDSSYAVNDALKTAVVNYSDKIMHIGSGFTEDGSSADITSQPAVTDITTTTTQSAVTTTVTTASQPTVITPVSGANVIYASSSGGGDGKSISSPTDVLTAIKTVSAGGYIYLLEGTYKYSSTIKIDESNAGSAGKYKTIAAYPGADVKFDFSGESVSSSSYGFVLDGSYWHFYGFEIANAGDNGMLLSGDNNIVEMMVFNNNQDTGLQISRYNGSYSDISQWPTNNLVKNCTSKNNCDDATMENADGFAAKLTCGQGNVFDGCMAYNNSDDGWDLYAKEATGPTGVVTIKNCIAFRNGFTEDGRGYGNCDGNGFKLGGGGVGTRHVIENCLAFENLNCGFTDNNNPLFGVMKNCTAYNNGIGGNGKGNYFVYRCAADADIQNIVTYYNTSKVSKTNAAGIKVSNDKFKGVVKNALYYNNKYYYSSGSFTADGSQPSTGTVVTPSDSDFISLSVAAMGADFHKNWRNASGAPAPGGFAETLSDGTYKTLGYRMSAGLSQASTPNPYAGTSSTDNTGTTSTTTSTASTTSTTSTTVTGQVTPVAGGYVHDFTANGVSSDFYSISGNLSTSKGTVTYAGKTLTQCLKLETATAISFNAPSAGTLTLVFVEPAATIKVDDIKYTSSGDGIINVELAAGSHSVTKADSANLFYMVYSASGSSDSTTGGTPDGYEAGDANCDKQVNMADAVFIMQCVSNPDKYQFSELGEANADVDGISGVTNKDALKIQQFKLGLVDSLT